MSAAVSVTDIARFFDRLVDLIPAKHYFDAGEAINLKYLKRAERDSAKASFKDQYKQRKKLRLDPDAAQTTTRIQQDRSERTGNEAGNDELPSTSAAAPQAIHANLSSSASREELQKRLQEKVSTLRAKRKADEQAKAATKAKEWRKAKLKGNAKPSSKKRAENPTAPAAPPAKLQKTGDVGTSNAPIEAAPTFVFNNLKVTEGERSGKNGKPKTKQQMLKDAEHKQAAAEQLGSTPEGKAKLKEEAWRKMMKLAQGEKILDDPQLLRRSIKKENKVKAKKAEAWQGRVDATKDKQSKAQQKRQGNLQKRVDEKKAKKVAKREKKLMRAGFEGRKDTFIT